MKSKIVTGILLILLLTNIVTTTFNVTGVFAFASTSPKTTNATDDLLKGVDFNETQNAENSAPNQPVDFWDLNKKDQDNTPTGYWGTNSTEIIVGLADTWVSYAKVEQLALAKNGKIVNKVLMGNKVEAVVVSIPLESVASFTTEVRENKLSRYTEPNSKYQAFMTPNDPNWTVQWGPKKIQADYAWDTTVGDKTVLVCVIDTGIDYNHPDIAANYVSLGYDWVNMDSDPIDDNGHGTHCAGIIGAVINNNIGIAGLAQVRLMTEKGLDAYGSGYADDLANAIIDATDKGANILSMSWGGSGSSTLIYDALKYAYDHGILLVAAAGNSGSSTKLYPAAYDEVIAVTATDPDDFPAWFTSYGDWVEIAAPGVDIYSTISAVHDSRFNYPYDYLSGTSMACPHVAGVAALVWSQFPNMARDVLRLHLRDTADDLGTPGFDVYYGYGRLNARRALEEPLPERDIFIASWRRPPYVEPNSIGKINATIVNYGRHNETGVTAEILINSTIEQSTSFDLQSGTSATISLSWAPTIIGTYNVTVYVLPVVNETNIGNNIVQGYVTVDYPLKVFVLRSAGTQVTTEAWETLNYNWKKFGNRLIYIDYTTLDKDNITYADLNATGADVLILSCSYAWEYTDEEIGAIKQYVYEGHGFIATAGTLYYAVPNNNKFAPMFGMNGSIPIWSSTTTDLLNLLDPSHPLFAGVPNPYTMPAVGTAYPYGIGWASQVLAGGTYVAMGFYNESAIVVYQGLVFISPWLEAIPEQYKFNLQILYNAITWSQYRKPEHDLKVSLETPSFMLPNSNVVLNATVSNDGLQDESDVELQLSVYDMTRHVTVLYYSQYIPLLLSNDSYTLNVPWHPTLNGIYNATAYAPPVTGENLTSNNKVTVFVTVALPLIHPQEGQWARYSVYYLTSSANMAQQALSAKLQLNYSKYISPHLMNVTLQSISEQSNTTDWTVVNIVNRYCDSGVWGGLWFPGMIETNITIGSVVNLLGSPATVIGNETIVVGRKVVECWKLFQSVLGIANYTWWYDKTDGLWIKLEFTFPYYPTEIIILDETNIPTGYVPEHELLVELEAPSFIALGKSSLLNATVSNHGLHNETNVELNLKINDTVVKSQPIAKLAVNSSSTISYSWAPLKEALYSVEASSPPVLGEDIISDNTVTAVVKVRTVKGHVLVDQVHVADSVLLYNTWIESVRDLGYIVDFNFGENITSDVLRGYDAFVTIQAHSWYSNESLKAIREFVAEGGGLLVVGDDIPDVYTSLTFFADISWVSGGMSGNTTYITSHEVTQGVSKVSLLAPNAMMNIVGSAQALVRDNYLEVMLAVNWYQRGRVMGFVDEDSLRDYGIGYADNLRLATNMIAWLCKGDTTPPETLIITLPSDGTIIGTTTVTVHWFATDRQSGISKYSVYRNGLFVANTTAQTYPVPNLVEGLNNITIIAYDKAGNSASRKVTIRVDLSPPSLQILTPSNGSYVKGITAIDFSGFDVPFTQSCTLKLYIDDKLVGTYTNGTHLYSWDTTQEYYGTHKIKLVGSDPVRNNATITVTVKVDNFSPTTTILSPANNAYVRGDLTISFVAQDLELKNASIMIGGTVTIDVTGSTSLIFDTISLSDGSYTVKLVAYDWAGNKGETAITITIDNTSPIAQITYPASNSYVKGTVNVTFTFADLNLENATLSIDSQVFDVTATTYYEWVTPSISDGVHVLTLTVMDKSGNSAVATLSVTVDNSSPTVAILSPSNNAYVRGNVSILFTAQDSALKNASIIVDSTTPIDVTGCTSLVFDTTTLTDGNYTIKLVAFDMAGNKAETSIIVTVDNTSPSAEITAPTNCAHVKGVVNTTFMLADSNLEKATLSIDGRSFDVTTISSYLWDTTSQSDGSHMLTLTVWDKAGNMETDVITVIVDNTPPIGEIRAPLNGAYLRGMLNMTFYGYDANLANMKLYINGSAVPMIWNVSGTYTYTTAKPDGPYTIKLEIYDKAGNQFTTTITAIVDNTPPTANILSPADNAYVKGVVDITFTLPSDSNLENATLAIDGHVFIVKGITHYTWTTTSTKDGNYLLTLTVSDKAGNRHTDAVTVVVDNTLPEGQIQTPLSGAYVTGTLNITFYGYDVNLTSMKLYIDGGAAPPTWNTSGTHHYSWDTTTKSYGTYTIKLVINDRAGNQFNATSTVTIDNTLPTVSISSPKNGDTVSGTVTINYTSSDESQYSLSLFIDNAGTIVDPHQPYPWDTTKVVDGNHTIRLVATDLAGNTKEYAITVKVANAPPPYMTYMGFAAAGLLGLALGAVIVWWLLKRKPTYAAS
jgi:subtilisin family serine protease